MNARLTAPVAATRCKANLPDHNVGARSACIRRNSLQKAIIDLFLPKFGHGAKVVCARLTGDQRTYHDPNLSSRLGIVFDSSNELNGIIAYSESKNWLFLIDAPLGFEVEPDAQHKALARITKNSRCDLVFVSVFVSINSFKRHIGRINWGTTVWLASEPDHTIHWNGGHYLEARY